MRTFVIGDIHGAHRALLQCLERSGFERDKDHLIALGDVCDVYPDVRQCFEELLSLKTCDYIIGNHDVWALDWAVRGVKPDVWLNQGGASTISSYGTGPMLRSHVELLNNAYLWLEVEKRVFVHGGFDPAKPIKEQGLRRLVGDRDLIQAAWKEHQAGQDGKVSFYDEIFLGHTPTNVFGSDVPLHLGNVWALDTGAGWSGRLTIMDIETKEYWQSDPTPVLYSMNGRAL